MSDRAATAEASAPPPAEISAPDLGIRARHRHRFRWVDEHRSLVLRCKRCSMVTAIQPPLPVAGLQDDS